MEVNPALIGSTLENYPLKTLLTSLAEGIAETQQRMDEVAIQTAGQLMDKKLTINGQERSLLELGFLPTFYHFDSATIKVSVTITMKVEQSTSTSVGASLSVGHTTKSDQDISTGGGGGTDPADGGGTDPAGGGGTDPAGGGETDPAGGGGTDPAGGDESVTIDGASFTLAELQVMNLSGGNPNLKSLGETLGLTYVPSENGADSPERKRNFGQKVFDAAKAAG